MRFSYFSMVTSAFCLMALVTFSSRGDLWTSEWVDEPFSITNGELSLTLQADRAGSGKSVVVAASELLHDDMESSPLIAPKNLATYTRSFDFAPGTNSLIIELPYSVMQIQRWFLVSSQRLQRIHTGGDLLLHDADADDIGPGDMPSKDTYSITQHHAMAVATNVAEWLLVEHATDISSNPAAPQVLTNGNGAVRSGVLTGTVDNAVEDVYAPVGL